MSTNTQDDERRDECPVNAVACRCVGTPPTPDYLAAVATFGAISPATITRQYPDASRERKNAIWRARRDHPEIVELNRRRDRRWRRAAHERARRMANADTRERRAA